MWCCQDYRPGITRADLEDEQRQQRIRDGLDPDPDLATKASRRSGGGAADDGSFSRPGVHLLTPLSSPKFRECALTVKGHNTTCLSDHSLLQYSTSTYKVGEPGQVLDRCTLLQA